MGLVTLVLVQSCESNKRANNYNNALVDDKGLSFFASGTETSLAAIKASGLAISNSRNQRVIQFAKMMIDDHTQLATDLEKLQAANFVISEDSISAVHQQMLVDLEKKRAAAFDKAYMQEIISEHEQQVALFNSASREKDPDISGLAQKTLPALKAHLDSAKAISLTLR
ncbi:MAG: hypothetical protein JWR23_594 [Mucilaginibacter sp.]|nr:hypothetical protein [Mucilaginibacter sp.]